MRHLTKYTVYVRKKDGRRGVATGRERPAGGLAGETTEKFWEKSPNRVAHSGKICYNIRIMSKYIKRIADDILEQNFLPWELF